jgi:hypothetical protein
MIQAYLEEYISLRNMGVDADTALQPLRARVEKLSEKDRAELVKRVREWERERRNAPAPPAASAAADDEPSALGIAPHGVIKKVTPLRSSPAQTTKTDDLPPIPGTPQYAPPASPKAAVPPPAPPPKAAVPPPTPPPKAAVPPPAAPKLNPTGKTVECPKCTRTSPSSEIFCPYCGTFLQEGSAGMQTARFEPEMEGYNPDHFGAKTTLILLVRHNKNQYRIQPQNYGREIVVGRSDVGAPMTPDIDLANQGAGELGVSRMHLSIHYDAINNTLSVTDMKSSNGSFVNNQKLHPHEVRVLRHGDELRLGRLVLGVTFQQG